MALLSRRVWFMRRHPRMGGGLVIERARLSAGNFLYAVRVQHDMRFRRSAD